MELSGGLCVANHEQALREDGAGVEAALHLHDRNACGGVAGGDAPGDGGCAAPAWEQGAVDVHAAAAGKVERTLTEDLAVGCDDEEVGLFGSQQRVHLVALERFGLFEPKPEFERGCGNRRRGRLLAPPCGAARLRDDEGDGHIGPGGQHAQRGNRKGCGPHEDNLCGHVQPLRGCWRFCGPSRRFSPAAAAAFSARRSISLR